MKTRNPNPLRTTFRITMYDQNQNTNAHADRNGPETTNNSFISIQLNVLQTQFYVSVE